MLIYSKYFIARIQKSCHNKNKTSWTLTYVCIVYVICGKWKCYSKYIKKICVLKGGLVSCHCVVSISACIFHLCVCFYRYINAVTVFSRDLHFDFFRHEFTRSLRLLLKCMFGVCVCTVLLILNIIKCCRCRCHVHYLVTHLFFIRNLYSRFSTKFTLFTWIKFNYSASDEVSYGIYYIVKLNFAQFLLLQDREKCTRKPTSLFYLHLQW